MERKDEDEDEKDAWFASAKGVFAGSVLCSVAHTRTTCRDRVV